MCSSRNYHSERQALSIVFNLGVGYWMSLLPLKQNSKSFRFGLKDCIAKELQTNQTAFVANGLHVDQRETPCHTVRKLQMYHCGSWIPLPGLKAVMMLPP